MILVTGGAGYIGSHTVVELISNGYEVLIVDSLYNSDISVLDAIEKVSGVRVAFEKIDLRDKSALLALANKYEITSVIHFAAFKAVKESKENPLKYYENNILGLVNILYLMKECACKQLIFSSSCTVYGEVDKVPVDEHFPIQKPFSPYGNTTKICEEIIEDCVNVGALNSIALRYFNPIGAHSSAILGDHPVNADNVMPLIIKVAKGELSHLNVYGDDYNTRDGSCVRDYVHVMDIASAHVKALDRMLAGKMESALECYTVLELLQTFEKVNSVKVNYQIVGRREGDVSQIYSDSTLAKNKLDWKIKYSLEDMLSSAWERDKKNVK